jgi:hypothetical protein
MAVDFFESTALRCLSAALACVALLVWTQRAHAQQAASWSSVAASQAFDAHRPLGVQGALELAPRLSAAAQLSSIRRAPNQFDVDFEWLYAQYRPIDGLALRAGRVTMPAPLGAEARAAELVGPVSQNPVYGLSASRYTDGVQGVYRNAFGPVAIALQATSGRRECTASSLAGVIDLRAEEFTSVSVTLAHGQWQARAAEKRVRAHSFAPLDRQTDVGVEFREGPALLAAEWSTADEQSQLFNRAAWNVAGSLRFGAWLPAVSYGRQTPAGAPLAALQTTTSALVASLRYTAQPDLALAASVGTFERSELAEASGERINRYGVVLSLTF